MAAGGSRENALVNAAAKMQKERWSYKDDPANGCAPAIVNVYKSAGIPLPWDNLNRKNWVPDIAKWLLSNFIKVPEKARKPADITVWKDTGYPAGSGKDPYGHIGIVMPDLRIANNSTGKRAFVNRMTPTEARKGWPNTKDLLYFRSPKVAKPQQKQKGSIFTNLIDKLMGRAAGGKVVTPKMQSVPKQNSASSCTPSVNMMVNQQMEDSIPVPIIVPFPVETQINSQSAAPGAVLRKKPLYRG